MILESRLVEITMSWWEWFGFLYLQISLLAVVIFVLDRILARFSPFWPQLRLGLFLLLFAKVLLPPSLILPTSIASPVVSRIVQSVESFSSADPFADRSHEATNVEAALAPGVELSDPRIFFVGLFLVWLTGIFVGLLLIFIRALRHGRLIQRAQEIDRHQEAFRDALSLLPVGRRIRLLASREISSPIVTGLFRPVILIPEDTLRSLSQREYTLVLLHELAHVRRWDLAVQWGLKLLLTLFWPHPFLWLARRRVKELQELCCDFTAISALRYQSREYRLVLAKAAKELVWGPPSSPENAALSGGSCFHRLQFLMPDHHLDVWKRAFVTGAVLTLFSLAFLPMGYSQEDRDVTFPAHRAEIERIAFPDFLGLDSNRLKDMMDSREGSEYHAELLAEDLRYLAEETGSELQADLTFGEAGVLVRIRPATILLSEQ